MRTGSILSCAEGTGTKLLLWGSNWGGAIRNMSMISSPMASNEFFPIAAAFHKAHEQHTFCAIGPRASVSPCWVDAVCYPKRNQRWAVVSCGGRTPHGVYASQSPEWCLQVSQRDAKADPKRGNPQNTIGIEQAHQDSGRDIPIMFLLYSCGSLFVGPRSTPLTSGTWGHFVLRVLGALIPTSRVGCLKAYTSPN